MNDYLDQLVYEMQLCGMSPVSQANYQGQVKRFLAFCDKPASDVGENDVRHFLHHLRYERKLCIGSVNFYHTCIRFFFLSVLQKPWNGLRLPRLRGYHTVPAILSKTEVRRIIHACEDLRQRAILATIYGTGLRISEACRLRVGDIRSATMQVFVQASKRNRERYTILGQSNLELLRQYWRQCGRPQHWLFTGERTDNPVSPRAVRGYLAQAAFQANITTPLTVHTLRHCFATHFLEDGHSIHELQPLLGHATIVSTARYVQFARPDKRDLRSPIDSWDDL